MAGSTIAGAGAVRCARAGAVSAIAAAAPATSFAFLIIAFEYWPPAHLPIHRDAASWPTRSGGLKRAARGVEMDQKRLIDAMHQQAKGDPMKLLRVAELALTAQDDARLSALCAEMLAAAPAGSPALNFADAVVGKAVPSWHFTMMRDARRNRAYDAALRRAVKPQSRVLEIGTGAGLLAMMAARAGAREVITCEVNPVIAAAAREVIALNGFADRIRVIGKHSSDLTLADIGGRADILVSEIVDSSLLGEGVLGAHEAAMRDLVKPGGVVIPGSGAIRVGLIDSPKLEQETLGIIDG
ncbi:hypothetical protein DBR17_08195, partial [Sphingomonas sp. HMWF008]